MSDAPLTPWVTLDPPFAHDSPATELLLEVAASLEGPTTSDRLPDVSAAQVVQETLLQDACAELGEDGQAVRAIVAVLCDLVLQGWSIRAVGTTVRLARPDQAEDRTTEKARVRRSLLLARDGQLAEPAVSSFVRQMERRRLRPSGWCSIFSLMRDGRDLAETLAQGAGPSDPARLRQAIRPYLQFVTDGSTCEWTGLALADIWRYFRHTWITPARSVPGRNMMVLVRDSAVEPHPVIGIAALGSSIVQQRSRDSWIGWQSETVLEEMTVHPSAELAAWLLDSLRQASDGVWARDFVTEGLMSRRDLRAPTPESITRLRAAAQAHRQVHRAHAKAAQQKGRQSAREWRQLAGSPLYRSKRASTLANLLSIRLAFLDAGLSASSEESLVRAMESPLFRKAVARLVRLVKAAHVGVNMMDIMVAGAVAPYTHLLGGKLVSLLLLSPEVRLEYARRYSASPSVIASAMKGEPVVRRPELVLLCTTGLFSGGSSQYNRVRLPSDTVGGQAEEVRFARLEQETSYSTFHISPPAQREMQKYMEQKDRPSDVHGIFGEGVNPRMRKIREGLDMLGLHSDYILQTGSPRAVYVIPVARNFREVLLGREREPDYIVPDDEPERATEQIAEFWRERWLCGRISRPGVLDAVRQHRLTYPVAHGARVALPSVEGEQTLLFDTEDNWDCPSEDR